MKNFKYLFLSALALLVMNAAVFAQAGATAAQPANADTIASYKAIAAGIGFGIAVLGGALGQGKIGAGAVEGAARNPSAAGRIQTIMILALALVESLVLFALLVVFVKL
ncbi:MAG: ATP synthase F0 subunit C [Pyrinomonadaceae bacterium]